MNTLVTPRGRVGAGPVAAFVCGLRKGIGPLAIAAAIAWAAPGMAQQAKAVYALRVDGLACPFCAFGIEKRLSTVRGVGKVEIEIKGGTVRVTMKDGAALDEATARKAIEDAGFSLRGFRRIPVRQ